MKRQGQRRRMNLRVAVSYEAFDDRSRGSTIIYGHLGMDGHRIRKFPSKPASSRPAVAAIKIWAAVQANQTICASQVNQGRGRMPKRDREYRECECREY
jgi:hypothetical protein